MNHEDELCTICEKGRLFMYKEDIQFGKITVIKQPLYICDTCDAAFQTQEDRRHTEYLRSMAYLRKYNKEEK